MTQALANFLREFIDLMFESFADPALFYALFACHLVMHPDDHPSFGYRYRHERSFVCPLPASSTPSVNITLRMDSSPYIFCNALYLDVPLCRVKSALSAQSGRP